MPHWLKTALIIFGIFLLVVMTLGGFYFILSSFQATQTAELEAFANETQQNNSGGGLLGFLGL